MEEIEKDEKIFERARKDGYDFFFDYEAWGTTFKCRTCKYENDAEQFLISHREKGKRKRRLIPITCPSCYGTDIEIIIGSPCGC